MKKIIAVHAHSAGQASLMTAMRKCDIIIVKSHPNVATEHLQACINGDHGSLYPELRG